MFFGFKSIKDAWDLPSPEAKSGEASQELGEFVEAEELVKEKVWSIKFFSLSRSSNRYLFSFTKLF